MAQQHPYQASVPASEQKSPIQQSLFPAWHDRRYTRSSDAILEGGKRMPGSFELLQGLVNEKQKEEDEENKRRASAAAASNPLSIRTKGLNKHDNGIATPLPSILVVNDQKLKAEAPTEETKEASSVRRSQSVRFNDEEQQQKQQFIRRSRSVRFTDEKSVSPSASGSGTSSSTGLQN